MSPQDRMEFAQAFNRLAVATRLPAGEADAIMQQVYWNGLSDLPVDVVVAAADAMSRSAEWFPKVSEWRGAASELRLQQIIQLPDGRDEPWRYECEVCNDTSWEILRCYPGTLKNCGRRRCARGGEGTYEHTYAVRCSCFGHNRTYQRQHVAVAGRIVHG